MKKLLTISILLFFYSTTIYSQVNNVWVNSYQHQFNGYDIMTGSAVDNDGNVYIKGNTSSIIDVTYKVNSNGIREWVKETSAHSYDIVTSDDGFIYGIREANDIILTKYSPNGDTIWERSYNGSSNSVDEGYFVTIDSLGYIIVIGFSREINPSYCIVTLKYDSNGNLIWSNLFGSNSPNTFPQSYALDASGNIFLTGSLSFQGALRQFAAKINSNGDTAWVTNHTEGSVGNDIIIDKVGNIYITGWEHNFDTTIGMVIGYFTKVYKYSQNGNLLWEYTYGENLSHDGSIGSQIEVDNQNNICVIGIELIRLSFRNPLHILKFNSSGDLLWDKGSFILADDDALDKMTNLKIDSYDNIYINGSGRESNNDSLAGIITAKYDSSGSLIWMTDIVNNSLYPDRVCDLFLDQNLIYTTGSSYNNAATGPDYVVAKYYQTSVGIIQQHLEIPEKFELQQNYPNPFNPSTKIKFSIPKSGFVTLKVYDITGKEVKTLLNDHITEGVFEAEFSGENLTSGIYFYTLTSDNFNHTRKMILLK